MTDKEYIEQLSILFSCITQGRPFMTYDYDMAYHTKDRFAVFSRKYFEEHYNQWMWKVVDHLTKEEAEHFMKKFMKKKNPKYGSLYTEKEYTYKDSYEIASDISYFLQKENVMMIEKRFAPKYTNVFLLARIEKAFLPRDKMTADKFTKFFRDEIIKDSFSSAYDFCNF